MKQDRSKYLKPEPIEITTRDFKGFNNAEDFYRFIQKHSDKFIYRTGVILGRFAGVNIWIPEDRFYQSFNNKQELLDFRLPVIREKYNKIHFSYDIKRLETQQEAKSRILHIKTLQQYPTSHLLNQRIKCRGSTVGNVILAILDTREHIPNGQERKKIRQDKAKKQRNY